MAVVKGLSPKKMRPFSITRREWLIAAGTVGAAACGAHRKGGFEGHALVATAGETSISVVDLRRFRLLKQVPLGGAPSQVVSGGPGGVSYALTPQNGSVHALDAQFTRVRSRRVARDVSALRLSRDGRKLFALAPQSHELIALRAATLDTLYRWKLPDEPAALDVSADGSVVVSGGKNGSVTLVEGQNGRATHRHFAGDLGTAIFRADGKVVLLAKYREQALSALSVPDLQLIVDLPVAMQPQNLCFNSDGGQLFVSGHGMDGVAIAFPYLPLEIDQTVLAGREPGVMACSEDPAYLFVASASGSDVAILNIDNRRVIGIVEVGRQPSFLTVTPDDQYALVLNGGSGDLAVIDIASVQANTSNAAKLRSKAGAALFTMLPVGDRPVAAAIVPRRA